jgi:sugar lactone lactonase YvrE
VAKFSILNGITADSSGVVYVVDAGSNNCRIRKIDLKGNVTTVAGNGVCGFADGNQGSAMFNNPSGVTVDSEGNVFVADLLNYRIRKISRSGIVTTLAGSGTQGYVDGWAATARFFNPIDVVADNQGSVYVIDAGNNKIRQIR